MKNENTIPFYKEVIEQGAYKVVTDWSKKDELIQYIKDEALKVIGAVAGEGAAKGVQENGLTAIHKFVSPDYRVDIQDRLAEAIKVRMLEYTLDFSREALGLKGDFYMDLMVIARVHFPFEVAKKSSMSYLDYSAKRGRTSFQVPPEKTSGFHKDLPFPAWAHGPHADSWFGHSFDGINLWWGIDGVTERSGMTFYPDYVGDNAIPVHDEPPYLAKDFPLPKPVFFDADPGAVIVFNSDTLHGTRVHSADVTRVSLSTRINPLKPRFNEEKFRHVKLWLRTQDIPKFVEAAKTAALPNIEESHKDAAKAGKGFAVENLIFNASKEDFGNEEGVLGNTCKKKLSLVLRVLDAAIDENNVINLGLSDRVELGEKVLVRAGNQQIALARTKSGLRALSAICPHVGYNLAAGGHDDEKVFCNGHGLGFDWATGRSECSGFAAQTYRVLDSDSGIQIHLNAK